MIATLVFGALAQTTATTAPPVADAQEIVVIGRRLKAWRGHFGVKDGEPGCQTTRSTGDVAIDAVGCAAMTACMGPKVSEISAMLAREPSRKAQQLALQRVSEQQMPCMLKEREAGIARLLVERRGS